MILNLSIDKALSFLFFNPILYKTIFKLLIKTFILNVFCS